MTEQAEQALQVARDWLASTPAERAAKEMKVTPIVQSLIDALVSGLTTSQGGRFPDPPPPDHPHITEG